MSDTNPTMEESVYSRLLRLFRAQTGMNQKQLADLLDVKQATVSRIESGKATPSSSLAEKIRGLPVKEVRPEPKRSKTLDLKASIRTSRMGDFSVASLLIPFGERSGDAFSIDKINGSRQSFFLSDTVGHGVDASRVSFALEFAYKTILASFHSSLITPELIEKVLGEAIVRTDKEWLGPPAFLSGMLEMGTGRVTLVNSGQPVPFLFNGREVGELVVEESSVDPKPLVLGRQYLKASGEIRAGGALVIFTDGFLELFNKVTNQNFRDRFTKAAKALKGDAEAILINLLETIDKELKLSTTQLDDDASVVLIARERER